MSTTFPAKIENSITSPDSSMYQSRCSITVQKICTIIGELNTFFRNLTLIVVNQTLCNFIIFIEAKTNSSKQKPQCTTTGETMAILLL